MRPLFVTGLDGHANNSGRRKERSPRRRRMSLCRRCRVGSKNVPRRSRIRLRLRLLIKPKPSTSVQNYAEPRLKPKPDAEDDTKPKSKPKPPRQKHGFTKPNSKPKPASSPALLPTDLPVHVLTCPVLRVSLTDLSRPARLSD